MLSSTRKTPQRRKLLQKNEIFKANINWSTQQDCCTYGYDMASLVLWEINSTHNPTLSSVTKSPPRLCSRDGKVCYYGRLEYDFLALVPCFLLLLVFPSLPRYVCRFRVPSSVQQSSAATPRKCVVRVFSSYYVICTLPHLGISFFYLFSISS